MCVHQNSAYKLFDVSYDGNLFDVGLGDSLNYISVLWWFELQIICLNSYSKSDVVQIRELVNVCLWWVKV